jgi:hypothetical protein
MLIFVDQPNHVLVVRRSLDASGRSRREPLGRIPKDTLDIPPEIASALTAEERIEVAAALDRRRRAVALDRQAKALGFPEQLRLTLEYLHNRASDQEKQIIVASIMEGVREIGPMVEQDAGLKMCVRLAQPFSRKGAA